MAIKTSDEILTILSQYIELQIKTASVNPNTILFDTFVDRLQARVAELYSDLAGVKKEQSINYASDITAAALDRLGVDWNVVRKLAEASTGTIVFISKTAPTATIRIGAADGSGGITVQTRRRADGTVVSYTTQSTVFFLTTTPKDPVTNTYRVTAPILCSATGSVGNAESGEIVVLRSSVLGVDEITNTVAVNNGFPEETNTQLARRIAAKVLGLHYGIENGLITAALEVPRVIDAAVSGPNDSDFVRDADGGEVDLIILGDDVSTSQENIVKVAGQSDYVLSFRPVLGIDSVQALVGVSNIQLSPDIDYTFIQDTTSADAYSDESNDILRFIFGGLSPNNGSTFTVTYRNDTLVQTVNASINDEASKFITASPLAKRALQSNVDISVSVVKFSGYDSEDVKQRVQTAISNFVSNLGLGDPLQQSDLVSAIKAVSGVDNVILPLTKLVRQGGVGVSDLTATKYEYFRVNSLGLSVSVS